MSQLEVDKIIPQSGTTLTIGDSGDTITFADGAVIGIDTDTLYIDSTNNRVGIGTDSPSTALDVTGTVTSNDIAVQQSAFTKILIGSTGANGAMLVLDGDSNGDGSGADYSHIYHTSSGKLEIQQDSPSGTNEMEFKTAGNNLRMNIGSGGDISFYEDTGTTPKLIWDASTERLGIGGSPSANLDVTLGANEKVRLGEIDIYKTISGAPTNEALIQKVSTGSNFVIGSPEAIYMSIDTDNNQTDRSFIIQKDSNIAGSGTELLRVTESGTTKFSVPNTDKLTSLLINPTLITGQTACKVAHVTKSIAISHTSGTATNTDFLIVDSDDEGWCTAYVMYNFYHTSGSSVNYYSANWSVGGLSTTPGAWSNTYSALLDEHFATGGFHTASAVDSSGTLAFRHTIVSGAGTCAGVGTMHAFFLYSTTNG